MENLFTLITWEYETSSPEIRQDQPYIFCRHMAERGAFYKVQIVNQGNENIKPFKLILGALRPLYKVFTMKDIKAAAERQKHVTVINWMKENNFKYIGDTTYIYKTFIIKTKFPIIQPVDTNEILSWRIGDFNIFNNHFTSVPKSGYNIGCIDIQTNRLCIETLISIIDLLS